MNARASIGRLIGIGVGPGDPELITLKAVRVLKNADVVVHFAKNGAAAGDARTIAAGHLRDGITELALRYPLTTEVPKSCAAYRDAMTAFYDESAAEISSSSRRRPHRRGDLRRRSVIHRSYMHLHVRLSGRYPSEVIAG